MCSYTCVCFWASKSKLVSGGEIVRQSEREQTEKKRQEDDSRCVRITVKERRRDRRGKGQVWWGGSSLPGMHSSSRWLSSHRADRKAEAQTGRSWPQIHLMNSSRREIINHRDSPAQHFSLERAPNKTGNFSSSNSWAGNQIKHEAHLVGEFS